MSAVSLGADGPPNIGPLRPDPYVNMLYCLPGTAVPGIPIVSIAGVHHPSERGMTREQLKLRFFETTKTAWMNRFLPGLTQEQVLAAQSSTTEALMAEHSDAYEWFFAGRVPLRGEFLCAYQLNAFILTNYRWYQRYPDRQFYMMPMPLVTEYIAGQPSSWDGSISVTFTYRGYRTATSSTTSTTVAKAASTAEHPPDG